MLPLLDLTIKSYGFEGLGKKAQSFLNCSYPSLSLRSIGGYKLQ